MAAALLMDGSACASVKAGAYYAGGNLTIELKNAGMAEILETIARTTGVDIYIASGFQLTGARMTLKIAAEPLEDVFRQILHGLNYAAIYVQEGDQFRIATVKIYPEGMHDKDMIPLFTGGHTPLYEEKTRRGETVTVLVNAGGDIVTRGSISARHGVLGPSETELSGAPVFRANLQSPWFAAQLQLEQEESERFAELLMRRKEIEAATDAQRKQALSIIYADEMAKFQILKKINVNKVESLKRIGQFQEVTEK